MFSTAVVNVGGATTTSNGEGKKWNVHSINQEANQVCDADVGTTIHERAVIRRETVDKIAISKSKDSGLATYAGDTTQYWWVEIQGEVHW